MTKPTPRYRAAAHVPNFAILVPAPELPLSNAINDPFRKMRDTLYRERQLWSGNESVEIRYVSGSSVAGTSASSPGVPRHTYFGCFFLFTGCWFGIPGPFGSLLSHQYLEPGLDLFTPTQLSP